MVNLDKTNKIRIKTHQEKWKSRLLQSVLNLVGWLGNFEGIL